MHVHIYQIPHNFTWIESLFFSRSDEVKSAKTSVALHFMSEKMLRDLHNLLVKTIKNTLEVSSYSL